MPTRSTPRPKKKPIRNHRVQGREAIRLGTALEKILYPKPSRLQNSRRYFGRDVDLDVIARAIRSAAGGDMVMLTDLGAETLGIDGHLTGIVQKRLNRAAAIGWKIVANEGAGIAGFDHQRSNDRADFVRAQFLRIPHFGERLMDLSWSTWNNRACLENAWEVGTGAMAGDPKLAMGWRLRDLYWIHPRRLSYNQSRRIVVMDDRSGATGGDFRPVGLAVDDIPEKFCPATPRLFGDYPEREGLLPRCLYWSFFQRLGTRERLQLMEIFGSPWRLAYSDGDQPASDEAIEASFEALQDMNTRGVAWLAAGVKGQIIQPGTGSGVVHKDVIEDARFVLSKLVLGGTSTTDAVSTGLGSSVSDNQLSEEDLLIATDLFQKAGVISHRMIDPIIELNYGPEELTYSPIFQFEIRGVVDRTKELTNMRAFVDLGGRVPLEEAYDRAGYRQPREDEPYLALVLPSSEQGMPAATPRSRIVYPPTAEIPPAGDLAIEPEERLVGSTPTPRAQPAPAPQPPKAGLPDAPTTPTQPSPEITPTVEPPSAGATEGGTAHPFASPSGLPDHHRD